MRSLLRRLLPLALLLPLGLHSQEIMRVRADLWMPFNGDPAVANQPAGYVVDLLRTLFEPAGVKIDYQLMPWTDALAAAADGSIDAVIGANQAEAAKLLVPKEPVGFTRIALITRADSTWVYENITSLRTVRFGVIKGYSYSDAFDEYIRQNPLKTVTTFEGDAPLKDAIEQLHGGKIDVVAETLPVFVWQTKRLGLPMSAFRVAHFESGELIYVAFAPGNPKAQAYADLLSSGIAKLRASGEFSTLLKRYGLNDWK